MRGMATTHRGPGPSRRVVLVALAAALPLGTSAVALSGPASAASLPTAPAQAAATQAAGVYAAVVARGSTHTLTLVNRSTGKVVRTLASARAYDWQQPFAYVDVAPDGSVWAVVRKTSPNTYLPYASTLVHYTGGKAVNVLPYVTSVRLSPNGKQLAITVLSPDGNKDGKGTQALRIATPSGKVLRTLSATQFPVDKNGDPTVEVGGLRVSGWLNPSTLIVGDGCCDGGSVALASASRPSPATKWPTLFGDGSTRAIGTIGDKTVLVARNRWKGDGQKVPLSVVGVEAVTMSAARPRGSVVAYFPDENPSQDAYVDRFVARAKAKPLAIGTKRYPYKGTGKVVAAYL